MKKGMHEGCWKEQFFFFAHVPSLSFAQRGTLQMEIRCSCRGEPP
jgi:hypothetical protein